MFWKKKTVPLVPTYVRPQVNPSFDDPDLANFNLGAVVKMKNAKSMLGHVIGFSLNIQDIPEVILQVKWCDGTSGTIHHKQVILLSRGNPPLGQKNYLPKK